VPLQETSRRYKHSYAADSLLRLFVALLASANRIAAISFEWNLRRPIQAELSALDIAFQIPKSTFNIILPLCHTLRKFPNFHLVKISISTRQNGHTLKRMTVKEINF